MINVPATDEGQASHVRFGDTTCKTLVDLSIHIHPVCEDNSDNDVHIFSGVVAVNLTLTYNQSDMLTVQFTIYAQPTDEGYGIVGAGDLTQETLYGPTTGTYKPVPTTTE